MFAGLVGVYFAFGVMVASIPPMIDVVRTDLGISRGAIGLALSAWTLLYIFTAPPAGRVVDRLGVGWSLTLGAVSLIASALARSAAQGAVSMWFAVAIMGLGGPLVSAAAPTLCAQWFGDPHEQQRAVGLYNLGPAIGGTTALFATNWFLLPWFGTWRRVLVFEAGLAAVVLGVWLLIWWRAPRLPEMTRARLPLLRSWGQLVRSRSVRHVLLIGTVTFFVMHSLNAWMVDGLSTQASISATAAGNWVAAGGFIGMGLIAVVAEVVRRLGRTRTFTTTWLLIIAGLSLVAVAPAFGPQVGVLITGARAMLVPLMIMTLMASPDVNLSNMGVANGLFFATAQIGATAGPFFTGIIADSAGGFTLAMLMLASVGAVALLIITQLSPTPAASP